jgi:hypothetical protein
MRKSFKKYTILLLEVWFAFFVATFAITLYFSHAIHLGKVGMLGIGFAVVYGVIVVGLIYRLAKQLPLSVLMLIIPIAPLVILLFLVALIPVIQKIVF